MSEPSDMERAELPEISATYMTELESELAEAINIMDGNANPIDWKDKEQPELLRKLCEHIEAFRENQKRIAELEDALKFYKAEVNNCNRHGKEGDTVRDRLAKDHGRIAEIALSQPENA